MKRAPGCLLKPSYCKFSSFNLCKNYFFTIQPLDNYNYTRIDRRFKIILTPNSANSKWRHRFFLGSDNVPASNRNQSAAVEISLN